MFPSFLITLREVIEAALIVATIIGILTKLGQRREIRTVWFATSAATLVSVTLLVFGSLTGFEVQELYTAKEPYIEGTLKIVSSIFITWAVFFLHNYFGKYKTLLLHKLRSSVEKQEQRGLFTLVFTAVLREGFEIALFLSTMYFSSNPQQILGGFFFGFAGALLISFGLFTATIRMPVFYAFRLTSLLLILFAANMLAEGVGEFASIKILPSSMFWGYTIFMAWWVFLRRVSKAPAQASHEDHSSRYR